MHMMTVSPSAHGSASKRELVLLSISGALTTSIFLVDVRLPR
jgi:hypothetical protein